jgi:hypothetical protein
METATQRIRMLERDLKKIETRKKEDSDSDDDDLDDTEAIKIEMEELKAQNQANQAKLDEYEKNKKWNVDNMFEVKEERTLINESAGKSNYTPTGFAQSTVSGEDAKKQFAADEEKAEKATTTTTSPMKPEEAAAASANQQHQRRRKPSSMDLPNQKDNARLPILMKSIPIPTLSTVIMNLPNDMPIWSKNLWPFQPLTPARIFY